MYNLTRAAEAGWAGPVADALDYELVSNLDGTAPEGTDGPDGALMPFGAMLSRIPCEHATVRGHRQSL